MNIFEKIKKYFIQRNPELAASNLGDKYLQRLENGEKDPMDRTAKDASKTEAFKNNPKAFVIEMQKNPDIPDKIVDKVITKIPDKKEISNEVLVDVAIKSGMPDKKILSLLDNLDSDLTTSKDLIRIMKDPNLIKEAVEKEYDILYKNCKNKTDSEVVDTIDTIRKLGKEKNIKDEMLNKIQTVIAKKMAENYYSDVKRRTKIYTFSEILPMEKMIKENLPLRVEKEYKKIEAKRGIKKGRFDAEKLEAEMIREFGEQIGSEYKKSGLLDFPQLKNIKGISGDKNKIEILERAIQLSSGRHLSNGEILDIEQQIQGNSIMTSRNSVLDMEKIIDTAKKQEKEKNLKIAIAAMKDPKIMQLIENLEDLRKMSPEKANKVADAFNEIIQKEIEYNKKIHEVNETNNTKIENSQDGIQLNGEQARNETESGER